MSITVRQLCQLLDTHPEWLLLVPNGCQIDAEIGCLVLGRNGYHTIAAGPVGRLWLALEWLPLYIQACGVTTLAGELENQARRIVAVGSLNLSHPGQVLLYFQLLHLQLVSNAYPTVNRTTLQQLFRRIHDSKISGSPTVVICNSSS